MFFYSLKSSLDLDQSRYFARAHLGPNCLQRLSTDDTNRQRVIITVLF